MYFGCFHEQENRFDSSTEPIVLRIRCENINSMRTRTRAYVIYALYMASLTRFYRRLFIKYCLWSDGRSHSLSWFLADFYIQPFRLCSFVFFFRRRSILPQTPNEWRNFCLSIYSSARMLETGALTRTHTYTSNSLLANPWCYAFILHFIGVHENSTHTHTHTHEHSLITVEECLMCSLVHFHFSGCVRVCFNSNVCSVLCVLVYLACSTMSTFR